MPKKLKPEAALQKLCMDWLAANRILHFRMNSGALRDSTGRPVRFGEPGMADVLAFRAYQPWAGAGISDWVHKVLWLEFKADSKQSNAQKWFQIKVESEGHSYYIVKSLEDMEAIFG